MDRQETVEMVWGELCWRERASSFDGLKLLEESFAGRERAMQRGWTGNHGKELVKASMARSDTKTY